MQTVTITWQRLLTEGKTCPRCGATESAIEEAAATLRRILAPHDIEVVLEKKKLHLDEFRQAPLQSNVIHINGRLLEEWLQARSGQSPCCEVCGPNDCRTVQVGAQVYEAIPAELIVQAGELAAQALVAKPAEDCLPCCGEGCSC